MNKKKEGVYDHITPELVSQVNDVIADSVKHNYSVSKVYGTHNAVFKKNDKPQTCSSCLRSRVRELKRWLSGYEKNTAQPEKEVDPQYTDPDAPGYVPQAEDTVRYPMAEGIPFDFLPNEGTLVKGTVTLGDGSKIKPGTYITAEGLRIVVQPGGKATIKSEDGTPFEDDLT